MTDEFGWLEADNVTQVVTGLDRRAEIMRPKNQLGKDRVWFCNGEYVWFRRAKSNPATLERHNRFVADGDYVHVETQDDVEVWELQDQSQFKTKKDEPRIVETPKGPRQLDISSLDNYNVMRQAALTACKRDWKAFRDIMSFLRERIHNQNYAPNAPGVVTPLAENIYAESYARVMEMINQRNGPSPGEINQELMSLLQSTAKQKERIITFGR